jgi:hypothetical protein
MTSFDSPFGVFVREKRGIQEKEVAGCCTGKRHAEKIPQGLGKKAWDI